MVGEKFMSFRCYVHVDKEVLVEEFVCEGKFVVIYSLFYGTLRCTYVLLD